MYDTVQLLAASCLGMLLAGLLLSVGFYVGYKAARNANGPLPRRGSGRREREWLRREIGRCSALAQQVARHAEQLTALASDPALSKSQRLLNSARDLLEHSANLSQRLAQLVHGAKRNRAAVARRPEAGSSEQRYRKPPQAAPAAEQPPGLSAQELGQITEQDHARVATSSDPDRKHYNYDCVQSIYPWNPTDGMLPALSDGVAVRCRDISGQGISFFWPTAPQFEHLIISLGNDLDLIFMAAEVARSQPVELDGAAMRLIECRFIRRMHELTDQWAGQLLRDEMNEQAEPALTA